MPILTSVAVTQLDQDSFHKIDTVARGLAFGIHNQMGRFFDEEVYQIELCHRLREQGFQSEPEMQITLVLDDFRQDYFVDLFVNQGVPIETKTARSLSPSHRAQLLNYLYLCGLRHGTLLNFRPERVEHEFVSTTISTEDRFNFRINTSSWQAQTPQCETMKIAIENSLAEWGRGLDPALYRNYIAHILGGKGSVIRTVPIVSKSGEIAMQEMYLLTEEIAYSVTAAVHNPEKVREHQLRLLNHTPLKSIQWCNLNRDRITLDTISK